MIVLTRVIQPCSATDGASGNAIKIPAGFGGLFIIHRGAPVLFYYAGNLCLTTRNEFCAATGKTQAAIERPEAFDGDDDTSGEDWKLPEGK